MRVGFCECHAELKKALFFVLTAQRKEQDIALYSGK
jgi:hypothetical protein